MTEDTQTGAQGFVTYRSTENRFGVKGEFVLYADYLRVRQERDTLKQALVEIINDGAWRGGGWCSRIAEAALAADLKGDPR